MMKFTVKVRAKAFSEFIIIIVIIIIITFP
jgi:hypothetical protein